MLERGWNKIAHMLRNLTKGQNEDHQRQDSKIQSHDVGLQVEDDFILHLRRFIALRFFQVQKP